MSADTLAIVGAWWLYVAVSAAFIGLVIVLAHAGSSDLPPDPAGQRLGARMLWLAPVWPLVVLWGAGRALAWLWRTAWR
jgi:hypothetical protein